MANRNREWWVARDDGELMSGPFNNREEAERKLRVLYDMSEYRVTWRHGITRTTTPLHIRYRGGSLDGRQDYTDDDQVPEHIAVGKPSAPGIWEHYAATDKRHDDGLLVEVTYVFIHED